jgi:hypothetical protein
MLIAKVILSKKSNDRGITTLIFILLYRSREGKKNLRLSQKQTRIPME